MDERRSAGSMDGLGDDQGTRVGAPSEGANDAPRQHSDAPTGREHRQTGAGSEATEGMHNAQQGGNRPESDSTALSGQGLATSHSVKEMGNSACPYAVSSRSTAARK